MTQKAQVECNKKIFFSAYYQGLKKNDWEGYDEACYLDAKAELKVGVIGRKSQAGLFARQKQSVFPHSFDHVHS